jgi:hypothetical protein
MSLGEILSDAIRYPFSDITKFLIVGILALLAGITSVLYPTGSDGSVIFILLAIISLVFAFIISGYGVAVIRNTIKNSDEIPGIDPVANIIDGIKVAIIGIVYYIIPLILVVIISFALGLIGAGLNQVSAVVIIASIIGIILFVLFSIFEIVAVARFADKGELGAALSIGEVIEDAKRVGILNIILFTIVAVILILILSLIAGVLALIPIIGIIVGVIILGGFMILFYNRGIGLLYASA